MNIKTNDVSNSRQNYKKNVGLCLRSFLSCFPPSWKARPSKPGRHARSKERHLYFSSLRPRGRQDLQRNRVRVTDHGSSVAQQGRLWFDAPKRAGLLDVPEAPLTEFVGRRFRQPRYKTQGRASVASFQLSSTNQPLGKILSQYS